MEQGYHFSGIFLLLSFPLVFIFESILSLHSFLIKKTKARKKTGSVLDHDIGFVYFHKINKEEEELCIDARARGNLARFVSHSCNPNAEPQLKRVHSEIHVGLYAKCDIKKGSIISIPFRFKGKNLKSTAKCICGSDGCRINKWYNKRNTIISQRIKELCNSLLDSDNSNSTSDDEDPVEARKQKFANQKRNLMHSGSSAMERDEDDSSEIEKSISYPDGFRSSASASLHRKKPLKSIKKNESSAISGLLSPTIHKERLQVGQSSSSTPSRNRKRSLSNPNTNPSIERSRSTTGSNLHKNVKSIHFSDEEEDENEEEEEEESENEDSSESNKKYALKSGSNNQFKHSRTHLGSSADAYTKHKSLSKRLKNAQKSSCKFSYFFLHSKFM